MLAALAQLLHLGHWPLRLFGDPVVPLGAAVVALARLGVYAGLAYGLAGRAPAAWAGAFLELVRTFLLLVLLASTQGGMLHGLVYPAGWAQGLLSVGLLPIVGVNMGLNAGWRPGPGLEAWIFTGVQLLAAAAALAAMGLRRRAPLFGVEEKEETGVLLREGLPLVLPLALIEWLAWLLSPRT